MEHLNLQKSRTDAGQDNIGKWNRTLFMFECTVTKAALETQIVNYPDHAIVLWGQVSGGEWCSYFWHISILVLCAIPRNMNILLVYQSSCAYNSLVNAHKPQT